MTTLPHLPLSHLTLRDELVLEPTNLANERTWLTCLRTGIALVVADLSLINFFREQIFMDWGLFHSIRAGDGCAGMGSGSD